MGYSVQILCKIGPMQILWKIETKFIYQAKYVAFLCQRTIRRTTRSRKTKKTKFYWYTNFKRFKLIQCNNKCKFKFLFFVDRVGLWFHSMISVFICFVFLCKDFFFFFFFFLCLRIFIFHLGFLYNEGNRLYNCFV